jgi:hypothetical protein
MRMAGAAPSSPWGRAATAAARGAVSGPGAARVAGGAGARSA